MMGQDEYNRYKMFIYLKLIYKNLPRILLRIREIVN